MAQDCAMLLKGNHKKFLNRRNANGEVVGTGMGLWIVDSIIQNYKGHIDLRKNIEEETGFFMDLFFEGREN